MSTQKPRRSHRKPKISESGFSLSFEVEGLAKDAPGYGSTSMAPWRYPVDAEKWEKIEDDIRRVYAWRKP
jgi:hypothetical protein